VTEAIGYMARLNRCGATPNRDGASTDAVVLQTYSSCLDAVDVALYTLAAGGHAWPQGHLLGAASPAATILDFIVRHPKS
jgi:poly(3-hydroxybutyrate) depolymerase